MRGSECERFHFVVCRVLYYGNRIPCASCSWYIYWLLLRRIYLVPAQAFGRGDDRMNVLPKEEEQKRHMLWKSGKSDKEMADILCISPSVVFKWRIKHGLKSNGKKGNRVHIEYATVDRLISSGKTILEVARIMRCSESAVRIYIRGKNE